MKRIFCLCIAMLMALSCFAFTSCDSEAKAPEGTYTRMTVDINPSVEFMIDDENKIVSVTALNDDGSILIAGEAFIGKTPEEATELIVSLAGETGYLVKGNVSADENTVKISVSGDSKYAEQLRAKVEEQAAATLEKLDIPGKIAEVQEMNLEALRALAMETALFTEEEVNEMTQEQLYQAIAAGRIETALLLTEEMRAAYYSAKESKISFAESEATAEIINAMGGAYNLIYIGYKAAIDAYSSAITAIDEFRYEQLVAPESEYQKSLQELRDAKTELLQQKNYVATLDVNGEEYASATVTLQMTEENYNKILSAYEALGDTLNQTLTDLVAKLRESEALLRSLEDKFSDNIKEELQAKAVELEAAMNEAKDSFFAEFEAEHKEDIQKIEESLIAQKNKLKESATTKEN
ncbi:MAG: hypothetical protein IJY39_11440 [Clostridia bacterium]|nr:hypothetical protein [Clostridia bacterium]